MKKINYIKIALKEQFKYLKSKGFVYREVMDFIKIDNSKELEWISDLWFIS